MCGQSNYSGAPVHGDATKIAAGETGEGMRRVEVRGFDLQIKSGATLQGNDAKRLCGSAFDKREIAPWIGELAACL